MRDGREAFNNFTWCTPTMGGRQILPRRTAPVFSTGTLGENQYTGTLGNVGKRSYFHKRCAQLPGTCQICFHPKFILHVNNYSKCYKMRYISWNSNGPLQRYGNPDMHFLGTLKNKFQNLEFLALLIKNQALLLFSGFTFNFKLFKLP